MPITAILFDLDETLMVEEASVKAALLATCEHARERYSLDPRPLSQTVLQHARQLWQASPTIAYCRAIGISSWEGLSGQFLGDDPNLKALREWTPAYRRTAWTRALAEHGVDDVSLAERLATMFQTERRTRHVVFPDAEATLKELRGTYPLALITNGAPDIQREKLHHANLAHYFEVITISGEVGIGKPDHRIFALTLDQLGVSPEAAVMIGDSLTRDILGAQRAGLKGVWLNRFGADGDEAVIPDAQIGSLAELRDVLS